MTLQNLRRNLLMTRYFIAVLIAATAGQLIYHASIVLWTCLSVQWACLMVNVKLCKRIPLDGAARRQAVAPERPPEPPSVEDDVMALEKTGAMW